MELGRDTPVERIVLGGLDADAVAELIARTSPGPEPSSDLIRSLHGETGGNPLFVLEVLAEVAGALREPGADADPRAVIETRPPSERVREIIGQRIRRLSTGARETLSMAAVAGTALPLALFEGVLSTVEGVDPIDALDEVLVAGLLVETPGGFAFPHAQIRQAVYGMLSRSERARRHRLIGEALEAFSTSGPASLAHHFGEAAVLIGGAKAAGYGLRAAEQAIAQLAFEDAVVQCERALSILAFDDHPDPRLRLDLLIALADARARCGDEPLYRTALEHALREARRSGTAQDVARVGLVHCDMATLGVPEPELVAAMDQALAAVDPGATEERAEMLATLAYLRVTLPAEVPRARDESAEALRLARAVGSPSLVGRALFARGQALAGTPDTSARLEVASELIALAQATDDLNLYFRALRVRAPALIEAGDLAGFDADVDEAWALAKDVRSWYFLAATTQQRAMRAMFDGRFAEAEALAAEALEQAHGSTDFLYAYANQLVVLRHEQGRLDELIPNMEATVRSNPAASVYQAALAWALALVRSPDAARPIVEQLTAGGQRVLPPDNFLPVTLTLLADAAVLVGDPAVVASILRQLTPFGGQLSVAGRGVVCLGAIDRRLGMLSAQLGRRGQAEAHLRSALALEERLQSRPLVARTTLELGRLLAETDGRSSKAALEQSAVLGHELGMAAVEREARDLLLTVS
jgi:tetratricopeptide (TPR) repeat protein